MPELPEVETVKRRLAEVLPGKTFADVQILAPKSFIGDVSSVRGAKIIDVSRRSKVLHLHLNTDILLATHLKMTGQLIYLDGDQRVGGGHPTADWTRTLPSNHTRIQYEFTDGSQLFFNDQRLFGWMKVVDQEQLLRMHAKLGPDIIDPVVTPKYFFERLQNRSVPIKVALMDNSIVAGVGNIYACDALNLARISPFRSANSLSFEEVQRLLEATLVVIHRGIDLQGATTDGKYLTVDGMAGGYQEKMLTYKREGLPCYNCGNSIKKVKFRGRGTYYCEACQG